MVNNNKQVSSENNEINNDDNDIEVTVDVTMSFVITDNGQDVIIQTVLEGKNLGLN